jgi:nicotinate phosphoribosyltransferase
VRQFPEAILLVDTYDTLGGIRNVIELAKELGRTFRVTGIRLDSGDFRHLAVEARKLLDSAGLNSLKIFASSSLDEYTIEELLNAGVPIDGFGVGGRMAVSKDAPMLDTAYKIVEYAGHARMKLSENKASLPGRKQVFRMIKGGTYSGDTIALANEKLSGEPLLRKYMDKGARTFPAETLDVMRSRCESEIRNLSRPLLSFAPATTAYPVELSPALRELRAHTIDLIKEDQS